MPTAGLAFERPLVLDGVASKVMEALTTGVVLAGLALHLGADDAAIGLLAALPAFAQLAQFPALRLVFRYRDRRRLCILLAGASRLPLFGVAALALVGPAPWAVPALFALWLASALVGAAAGISWTYWMRDLIPRAVLGEVFSRRMRWQGVVAILFIAVSGGVVAWLTAADRAGLAYATLFATGGLAGLVGLLFIRRIPTAELDPFDRPPRVGELLRETWARADDRRPMLFVAVFGFATTLAFPFITVFMLARLGVPFLTVALLSAASLLASIAMYPLWGRLTDRFGNKPVLAVALPALVLTLLVLTVVEDASAKSVAVLAVVHLVNGAVLAALDLASANLVLKQAPAANAGGFLVMTSAARSVCSGAAAVLGGALAAWFAVRELAFDVVWRTPSSQVVVTPLRFTHYDFLFLASALLVVYALHRLALVREEGEAAPKRVLRELHLSVQSTSSVVGARMYGVATGLSRHLLELRRGRPVTPSSRPPERPPTP